MADKSTRDEIEKLVAGEYIEKNVRLELTYDEIDNTIDNLWSVLFATGYLTHCALCVIIVVSEVNANDGFG